MGFWLTSCETVSVTFSAGSSLPHIQTMIISCTNVLAARSLSAARPDSVSRFAVRVHCASRWPALPSKITALRSVRSKAPKVETAVAAVKAWSEQHEVCLLMLAESRSAKQPLTSCMLQDDLTPLYAIFLFGMVAAMSVAAAAVGNSV